MHFVDILSQFCTFWAIFAKKHIWYHIECHARVLFSFCFRNFAIFSHFGAISGHFEPYYGHFGSFWDHFGPISDMVSYGIVCYAMLG